MKTLPPTWHKTVKFVHHLAAMVWAGGIIVSLFILFQLKSSPDGLEQVLLNKLVFDIAYKMISPAFSTILITGLIFGLYTKYGFFRYKWIIGKWILLVLAFTVFSFFYIIELHIVAALSDIGITPPAQWGLNYNASLNKAFTFCLISLFLVLAVFYLSSIKPWGIRKGLKEFKTNKKLRVFVIAALVIVFAFSLISEAQFNSVRKLKIKSVDLSRIISDTYQGEYNFQFPYKVKVVIEDGIITELESTNNRENLHSKLAEGVILKILNEQRIDVDAVTGATTTSIAIQKAVENALIN